MKYKVGITRTAYSMKEFEVEANSEEEAKKKAIQIAYDTVFSEGNVEYDIESIETEGK